MSPNFRMNEEFYRATKFKERLPKLLDEVEQPDWLIYYARQKYDESETTWEQLDSKADAIIRYLGVGIGLLTFGAISSVSSENIWVILAAVPAVLCALRGVYCASEARMPAERPSPPLAHKAVACARKHASKSKAMFCIGDVHLATVLTRLSCEYKADLVSKATRWFRASLLWLLLPLAIAVVMALNGPSSTPPSTTPEKPTSFSDFGSLGAP